MDITVVDADITTLKVDAIVNAANSELLGGGGVDGAIHRAAGPQLLAACRTLRANRFPRGLPTGEAIELPGFKLPATWVILTVGPIYDDHPGGAPHLLAACYRNCLDVADRLGLESVAFPAISTGVYGWPPEPAAQVAVDAIRTWAAAHPNSTVHEVLLVAFSLSGRAALKNALATQD